MKPIESKRIALDRKIVLRFPNFDGFVTEYAGNISMTGMFIKTALPQPPGTPVSVELRLEGGAPLVRGDGWVVWAREQREGPDRPAGMGIEFTELERRSRRLVRWMILSQLPEGQAEFDVHAGTASAPTTARLTALASARRNRRSGLLTAVAVVALLAGLVLWRGPGAGPDRRQVATNREASEPSGAVETADVTAAASPNPVLGRTPDAVAAEAPAVAAMAAAVEPEAAAGASAVDNTLEEARELVWEWARAWSEQDVEAYLGHYASDFQPEGGMTRSQWRSLRRQRLTAPRSIHVAVTRLEARLSSEREATVTFLQTYRSDAHADTVDKVLELERENGVWKIRRELAD